MIVDGDYYWDEAMEDWYILPGIELFYIEWIYYAYPWIV